MICELDSRSSSKLRETPVLCLLILMEVTNLAVVCCVVLQDVTVGETG